MRHERVKHAGERWISEIAGRQGGVVSVEQLRAAGLDGAAILRRVHRGLLHPYHRGVYAVGHTRLGAVGRWWAAVLVCGDGAVLSHRDAAAALDLLPVGSGDIHVSVPVAGGRRRHRGVRVHRTPALGPDEVTLVDGLPVTMVERTLADLAATVPLRTLTAALEQAEARSLVDRARLGVYVASSRAGVRRLRVAVGGEPALTRSVLEERFLKLCRRYDLPAPQVNCVVALYVVDFLWPDRRLIVETDGRRHHDTRRAFEEDRRRDVDLVLLGYRVVRFTYEQVTSDPAGTASKLRRLLA